MIMNLRSSVRFPVTLIMIIKNCYRLLCLIENHMHRCIVLFISNLNKFFISSFNIEYCSLKNQHILYSESYLLEDFHLCLNQEGNKSFLYEPGPQA